MFPLLVTGALLPRVRQPAAGAAGRGNIRLPRKPDYVSTSRGVRSVPRKQKAKMVFGSDFSGGFPLVLSNRAAATTAAAAAANPLISAAAAGDPHQAFNYPLEVSERRKGKEEIEPPPKKVCSLTDPLLPFHYSTHSTLFQLILAFRPPTLTKLAAFPHL